MRTPAFLCLLSAVLSAPPAPVYLRVDLQLSHGDSGVFVTLDAVAGVLPSLLFTWALPPVALSSPVSASRVIITSFANTTAFDSGWVSDTEGRQYVPRSSLEASRGYSWTVAVRDGAGADSVWASPQQFFTSAGAPTWAASAPVWAAPCDGGASPKFAYFRGAAPIPTGRTVQSALLYVTGSPPIYNDPWNVTKLLGGYKLWVNGTSRGVGPGRTACGPVRPGGGPCVPVQPVDGYDVSDDVAFASAAGGTGTLPLELHSYGLTQNDFGIVPAVQLALHIRWSPEGSAPDTLFGTTSGASGAWTALAADALVNPGPNKAPFWYTQPREDVNLTCLPTLTGPSPCGACVWTAPVVASNAWLNGSVPLAGKSTQALSYTHAAPASVTQLGPGWFVLDSGSEFQGGARLTFAPGAAPAGAIAIVQLSSQLAANGSTMWLTRAGNKYQDTWSFPGGTGVRAEQLSYEHHEYCEFRYAEIILKDASTGAPLDIAVGAGGGADLDFWVVRYLYNEKESAHVSTSDADVDAVWTLASNTLKTTTLDFYADSNTRQRSIDCMADDTTAALSQYYTTPELSLPRMVSAQIMDITDLGYISPNWADWTVLPALNIVNDALFTGDVSFAAPYFDVLVSNHTYAYLIDPATNLVRNGPDLSALIDTSGGSDDGYAQSDVNSVVNSWSYLALRSLAKLGRWLNRTTDAASLDATAAALAAAFQAAMFNGTNAICDGLCSKTPHTAAHATFYALYSGVLDGAAYTDALVDFLLARLASSELGMPCGTYPSQFLISGLYNVDADHGRAAHAFLTSRAPHSWLNMIQVFGATTTMECWLPEELENLSFSHVWSSSPSIIIPSLFFGVTPTSPGYRTFTVKPQPGPVLSGEATLPSVAGPIAVGFTQTAPPPERGASTGGAAPDYAFELRLSVPGGCVATALLPIWGCAAANIGVTVDGETVAWTQQGDYAAVTLSGGFHSLSTSVCAK